MAVRDVLAGRERRDRRVLPAAELLAPLPLAALAILVVNDWVLKRAMPGAITGKLSDFTGVFVFPLIATSALDCVLLAASRLAPLRARRLDFTLRRWKLAAAIAFTAALFAATKLVPAVAAAVAHALGRGAHIVADPTDLVALVVLAGTWLHGRATLARGSYGRLEYARRANAAPPLYADALACGADPAAVAAVEQAVAAGADDPLAPLRR